jgi:hypothetical protein
MRRAATKAKVWSEFEGGTIGWDVCLNNTSLGHVGLLPAYARAYHKAAKRLVEEFRQALSDNDIDAHPVVFLYRHALEVYLETVLDFGDSLLWFRGKPLKGRAQILKGHGLTTLLPRFQEIFNLIDVSDVWDAPFCTPSVDIERMIRAIDNVTHDAVRYPVRIRDGNLIELLPDGLEFNLLTFANKMDALLNVLDATAMRVWETFQAEALAEMKLKGSI